MASATSGSAPDITRAHLLATVIAGVPIVAHLLAAFGVYDPSPQQQQALSDALTWAGVLAAALIGGDTGLRASRNFAAARGATPAHWGTAGAAGAPAPVAVDPATEPGDPDVLAHVPVHTGPVPPDQGDAKTATVA